MERSQKEDLKLSLGPQMKLFGSNIVVELQTDLAHNSVLHVAAAFGRPPQQRPHSRAVDGESGMPLLLSLTWFGLLEKHIPIVSLPVLHVMGVSTDIRG